MKTFEIIPLHSFGQLDFGMFIDQVVELVGEPDMKEELDMSDDGNRHVVYRFDSLGLNLYFEGIDKSVLACIETDNDDVTLYGETLFDMSKDEIVRLINSNGFSISDQDDEDGEQRVSFDELGLDLFFFGDELDAVCFGVPVDCGGNIVT